MGATWIGLSCQSQTGTADSQLANGSELNVSAQAKRDSLSASQPVQLVPSPYFKAPLAGDISLSGTFAELRNNHFHGGLDIRTGGRQGLPVLAAATGYVARVKVSAWGYGKALYLQHPNGTQTVYGHLSAYAGVVADAVSAQHYNQENFEMDWYPQAGQLHVKQGDTIAWSGNTGGSGGPHLHFEVREAQSSDPLNPLQWGISVQDTIAPHLRSLYVYQIDEEFRKRHGYFPYAAIGADADSITLEPGRYALGIRWVDYFTDRMSKLGVNYARLTLNGDMIFEQELERFGFEDGRQINVHIDYALNQERGIKVVKLFQDQGNKLKIYKTRNQGFIDIREGERYPIELQAWDLSGNRSSMVFVLKGGRSSTEFKRPQLQYGPDPILAVASKGLNQNGAFYKLSIPPSALIYDSYLSLEEMYVPQGAASQMLRIHTDLVPLQTSYTLRMLPHSSFKGKKEKLVVMNYNPKRKTSAYASSKWNGEYVEAALKNFGMYYLKADTIAPVIRKEKLGRQLRFRVSDNLSGIDHFRCTIGGKWVLLEYEPKLSLLSGTVPRSVASGNHPLKLIVKDAVGNQSEFSQTIHIP